MLLNKIRLLSQIVTPYAPHLVDLAILLGIPLGVIYPDAEYLYIDYAFLYKTSVKLHSKRYPPLHLHVHISEESFAILLTNTAANIPISETLRNLDILFV